jgi:hypothetical protein
MQRYGAADSGSSFGDCHRTCIAMILDLDRDEVPHFMEGVPKDAPADAPECQAAEQAERDWLAGRGLVPVYWGYDGGTPLEDVLAVLAQAVRGTAVILGCTSPNGHNHSVVVYEGRVYNPSGGAIAGPMRGCSTMSSDTAEFWAVTAYAHATKPLAPPVERNDETYTEPLPAGPAPASVATQED